MTKPATETQKTLQVEIFPSRLLKPDTAQKLLSEISKVDGIYRAMIQGPRLPLTVPYGPAKGEAVDHHDRKIVQIGETTLELSIMVGRIRLEIRDSDVKEEIREVCDEILPFSYEYREGHFIATKQTVSDYAKRGPNADKAMLGLSDPKAKVNNQICILSSKEE